MNREQERRIADLTEAVVTEMRNIMSDDQEQALEQPMEMEEQMLVPTPMQDYGTLNKASYQPEIRQVNNGFIVRLGCQSFVFETFDKMFKYLKMYFEDPNGTETKFHKNELF
jgi:hypothetical protein